MKTWERLVKNMKVCMEIHPNSNPYSYSEHWARRLLSSMLDFNLSKTSKMINIRVYFLHQLHVFKT